MSSPSWMWILGEGLRIEHQNCLKSSPLFRSAAKNKNHWLRESPRHGISKRIVWAGASPPRSAQRSERMAGSFVCPEPRRVPSNAVGAPRFLVRILKDWSNQVPTKLTPKGPHIETFYVNMACHGVQALRRSYLLTTLQNQSRRLSFEQFVEP